MTKDQNVSKVVRIPVIVPKRQRKLRALAIEYHDGGYQWDVAVIAALSELRIDKLENRVRKLEGKKTLRNFPRKKESLDSGVLLFQKSIGG